MIILTLKRLKRKPDCSPWGEYGIEHEGPQVAHLLPHHPPLQLSGLGPVLRQPGCPELIVRAAVPLLKLPAGAADLLGREREEDSVWRARFRGKGVRGVGETNRIDRSCIPESRVPREVKQGDNTSGKYLHLDIDSLDIDKALLPPQQLTLTRWMLPAVTRLTPRG